MVIDMKKAAYVGTKIIDLAEMPKILICHDGLFSKDEGENFPIKYVEFPDSIVKNNND